MVSEKKVVKKPAVEWDAIEPHYRAGIRSLKDIGAEYGVSDAAIVKHAKKHGWTRNLAAKIAARAEAKVSAAAVSAEVSAQRSANQEQVVEANADLQYRVRMKARQDIVDLEEIVLMLMAELRAQTTQPEVFDELAEIMRCEDERGQDKRNDTYRRVISFSGRVDSAKKLVEMVEKLVLLKFKLFGIKDEESQVSDIDTMLLRVAREKGLA